MRQRNPSPRNRQERGFVLLLTVLTMLAVLPIIGMAVDIGMIYLVQTRLSAAIDAGALAGARSFQRGMDLASQTASAQDTASRYFRANFPKGYLGTDPNSPDPTIDVAVAGAKRTVTITSTVTAPMYFLRYLTINSAPVTVTGQATRGDVNLIMVMDRSGSLANSGSCTPMKAAAVGFVDKFSEGRDNVGLVTFARSSTKNFPASLTFKTSSPSVTDIINNISCAGWTFGSGGLAMGYEELQRLNQPGALNVIVYFTDGMPNVVAADFPIKRSTTSYTPTAASSCVNTLNFLTGTIDHKNTGVEGPFQITGLINPPKDPADNSGTATVREDMIPQAQRTSCRVTATAGGSPSGTSSDNPDRAEMDIAYIPDTDLWGTSLDGYFGSPARYTTGPYTGKIRADNGSDLEFKMGLNAVDNLAVKIRHDATLKPVIFTIGLGTQAATDSDLLHRVANDPGATNYESSYQAGKYIYVADYTGLDDAFLTIASEILRLSM
ncbi:MAG: VWA domain-containing protein [Acidobacteria bacterium]|nr:VWA domain-containing protein [Acidobacteriota bacterium]